MNYVFFLTGIWVSILPYMSWNKDEKKFSMLHIIIGLYTCLSAILNWINDTLFSCAWIQIAYIFLCILEILEIIKKFKSQRAILDTLAIVTAVVGLVLSFFVFLIDYSAVDSSILMIVGAMIILSVPFNRIGDKFTEN